MLEYLNIYLRFVFIIYFNITNYIYYINIKTELEKFKSRFVLILIFTYRKNKKCTIFEFNIFFTIVLFY